MQLKRLREQVIVITGASSGIGLATAKRAARRGAVVFLISRNEEALANVYKELDKELELERGRAAFAAADVGMRLDFEPQLSRHWSDSAESTPQVGADANEARARRRWSTVSTRTSPCTAVR